MKPQHSSVISKIPIKERILLQSSVNPETGCWEWHGSKNQNGYGLISIKRKTYLAHRISFKTFVGPIPPGDHHGTTCVCHSCDVRNCVNPSHFFLATQAENVSDMYKKGRNNPRGPMGTENGHSKLTENDVREIRSMRKAGRRLTTIAKKYGIQFQTVSKIANRKSWKHVE